ncbi:prion-like-(Q/N-rich) domain-bearing protein 25 [Cotesia glomerata]|uniref:prion-like-(Q/N-rich) domain-bearing protein 25 n=1 Tax=Cotesia glomerata TaxID=32391 RepID=UPI001D002994|nr:prion-like-(Q/N-rich) domain-bearing protein 25 [Cotesia glomerata]
MSFAVCSSSGRKCICRDGYFEIKRGTCVLQLKEICRIDRQCRIPNSVCDDGYCECEPGFLNIANNQCVLIESSVRSCYNNHRNCRLFTNAKYLKNGQYVCTEYRVEINTTACAAWSGRFCTNGDQCGSKYSVCVNNECQCKLKYVSHSDIDCRTPFIGMTCNYDSYCKKFIKNSLCLNKICICGNNYSEINGKCLPKLLVSCSDKEPCAPKNSFCIDEKCHCNIQYIQQEDECVPRNKTKYKEHEDAKAPSKQLFIYLFR